MYRAPVAVLCLLSLFLFTLSLRGEGDPTKSPADPAKKQVAAFRLKARAIFANGQQGNVSVSERLKQISNELKLLLKRKELNRFLEWEKMANEKKLELLYKWLLHRSPNPDEKKVFALVLQKGKDKKKGFQDIIWALANSMEMLKGG